MRGTAIGTIDRGRRRRSTAALWPQHGSRATFHEPTGDAAGDEGRTYRRGRGHAVTAGRDTESGQRTCRLVATYRRGAFRGFKGVRDSTFFETTSPDLSPTYLRMSRVRRPARHRGRYLPAPPTAIEVAASSSRRPQPEARSYRRGGPVARRDPGRPSPLVGQRAIDSSRCPRGDGVFRSVVFPGLCARHRGPPPTTSNA